MVSMATTVVGVFDDYAEAESTRNELLRSGFREEQVRMSERSASDQPAEQRDESGERGGFWDNVRDFFGIDEDDTAYYEEASRRGGAVITVSASQDRLDAAVDIIQKHNPVDIDRRAEEWRKSGWEGPQRGEQTQTSGQTSGRQQERIPQAEEKLKIGKRKEQRGGVRIFSHTREQPVEEDVRLREEHVDVKRQPADRPADESAFEEKTVEARETREEPVVRKESRVTEDVVVDRDVEERDEKVRDTLRKTEVDIEDADQRGHAGGSKSPGTASPKGNKPRR